jgi:hypothetical protein
MKMAKAKEVEDRKARMEARKQERAAAGPVKAAPPRKGTLTKPNTQNLAEDLAMRRQLKEQDAQSLLMNQVMR